MYSHISISLVFLVLILSSCSFNWDDRKDEEITRLKTQIEELSKTSSDNIMWEQKSLFNKRQACISLTESLIKRTEQIAKVYHNEPWKTASFVQVFYSSQYDNCLWVRLDSVEGNWWSNLTHNALYEVWNDSGTSKPISSCIETFLITNWMNNCEEFDELIKKLKQD